MKPALPSSTPSISIALAAYNGERYLREQLESLANQTVPPLELVVSDDGSSDRTIATVNAFAASAPFPVVIHENSERLGYAGNFLEAARLCQGDVIAFCDQDDVWRRDKLERCGTEFRRSEVGLVVHNAQDVDEDLAPRNALTPGIRRSEVLSKGTIHPGVEWPIGCTLLVKRPIMQEVLRLWPRHDADYMPRPDMPHLVAHDSAAYFVGRSMAAVSYLADPLICHRCHRENVTGPRPTWISHISGIFRTGAGAYREKAEYAGAAAKLYSYMAASAGNVDVENGLQQVALRFHRYAASLRARSDLYTTASRYERIRAIARMANAGVYGCLCRGGVGPRAIGKDLLWAVLGPARQL